MIDYCTISTFLIYSTPLGLLIILEHCTCNSMYFLHLAFGRTTLEAVPPRKRLSAKIVSRAHLPRIVHLAYHHLGLFNGVCAWCRNYERWERWEQSSQIARPDTPDKPKRESLGFSSKGRTVQQQGDVVQLKT